MLHFTRSRMASCIRAMAPNRIRKFSSPSSTLKSRFPPDENSERSSCQIAVDPESAKSEKTQMKRTKPVTNPSRTPNSLRSRVVRTAARTRSRSKAKKKMRKEKTNYFFLSALKALAIGQSLLTSSRA